MKNKRYRDWIASISWEISVKYQEVFIYSVIWKAWLIPSVVVLCCLWYAYAEDVKYDAYVGMVCMYARCGPCEW